MVPGSFSWESLSCFVAENNPKLVVLFRNHFLPWAFLRLSGVDGKLGRNGGFSDMNIRVQHLVGLFLLLG